MNRSARRKRVNSVKEGQHNIYYNTAFRNLTTLHCSVQERELVKWSFFSKFLDVFFVQLLSCLSCQIVNCM